MKSRAGTHADARTWYEEREKGKCRRERRKKKKEGERDSVTEMAWWSPAEGGRSGRVGGMKRRGWVLREEEERFGGGGLGTEARVYPLFELTFKK